MDECLSEFFQARISRVRVRVRRPYDLECETKKARVSGPVSENHVILRSLVLTHFQRVTDEQTDGHAAYSEVTH